MKKNRCISLRNTKIGTRLILFTFIIVLGICTILTSISFSQSSKILKQTIESTMINRVNDNAKLISKQISTYQIAMETLAKREDIISMDWNVIKPITLSEAQRLGLEQIQISTTDGMTHVKDLEPYTLADKPNFKLAMQGVTNTTSPLYSEGDNKLIMIITTPIYNNDENIVGILGGVMTATDFNDIVQSIDVGDQGYSFVVDKNGVVISHKDIALVKDKVNYIEQYQDNEEYKDFVDIQSDMINKNQDFKSYTLDGEKMYISYTPIPDTDWSLGCAIPESEIMQPIATLKNFMIGLTILFMGVALIAIFILANSITKPLKKITKVTDQLAKGNLDATLDIDRGDEIGKLGLSVHSLVQRLNGYIEYINEISYLLNELGKGNLDLKFKHSYDGEFKQLKDSFTNTTNMMNDVITKLQATANDVTSGAEQVSIGSQSLAQGATEQASAVEELSATINEITTQVKNTAESSILARDISLKCCDNVDIGQQQMIEMINAMNDISNTSNKIGKIIRNIEDIAFQTNILALNAAVEAARAGSAGKGFSVVAEEVRNLAAKSAKSAKDTAELIQSSITAVENGTKVASETEKSLNEVISGTKECCTIVEEIAEASNDQAESIVQINTGVEQIASVVQTNSATAEHSASTTEDLVKNAEDLKDIIKIFTLKDNENKDILNV